MNAKRRPPDSSVKDRGISRTGPYLILRDSMLLLALIKEPTVAPLIVY